MILSALLIIALIFGAYERNNISKFITNVNNADIQKKVTALNNKINAENKSTSKDNAAQNKTAGVLSNTVEAQTANSGQANSGTKPSAAQQPAQSTANKPSQGTAPIIRPVTAAVSSTQSNKEIKVDNNVQQIVVPANTQQGSSQNSQNSTAQEQQVVTSYICVANNYSEYYNEVKGAMENFNDSITIKISNYNANTYNLNVVNKILDDYYDIDYGISGASGTVYTMGNVTVMEIKFQYSLSRNQMLSMRDASKAKANAIVASIIRTGMSDLDKELAIHNYIVNNTAYDYTNYVNGTLPEQSFTDYGVLITGKAVCEGYAKAMFRLMNLAGVECKVVKGTGDGQAHAWNIVKIDGSYCQVDSTWDDPVTTTGQNILSYNYFDLSDAQMAKDHQWDASKYPSCTTTKYNRK